MSLEILGKLRWTHLDPATVYAGTIDTLADEIVTVTARGTAAAPRRRSTTCWTACRKTNAADLESGQVRATLGVGEMKSPEVVD